MQLSRVIDRIAGVSFLKRAMGGIEGNPNKQRGERREETE
jgi:hypothetical protein